MNGNYLAIKEMGNDVCKGASNITKILGNFIKNDYTLISHMIREEEKKGYVIGNPLHMINFGISSITLMEHLSQKYGLDIPDYLVANAFLFFGTNIASGFYEWFRSKKEIPKKNSLLESKISEEERMVEILRKDGHSNELIYETLIDPDFNLDKNLVKGYLAK